MKKLMNLRRLCALALALTLLPALAQPARMEAKTFEPRLSRDAQASVTVAGHYSNFEALEAEFNRFNAYYPEVELTYVCLDNYNRIISTAVTGAEAPDIFFTFPWMANSPECAPLFEAAEDLSDPALGIDLSCIRPGLLHRDEQGRVPSVPIYTTTYGMMVNEDIFAREGIAIPTTYAGLVSACEALQKAGYAHPMMGHSSLLVYPLYHPFFYTQIKGDETALRELNALAPSAGEYARGALELAADFMGRGFIDLESCHQLENDYNAVIMRFYEGDVPMMLATANTVSGTEKREKQSEAFSAHPFAYSFHPVPCSEEGGCFVNYISMSFSVNSRSANLEMVNEFMRFLITTEELNRTAQAKRMVTPCIDMSLDGIYAAFGQVPADRVISVPELGLANAADDQVRLAGTQVSLGTMTVEEAVAAFGTLK